MKDTVIMIGNGLVIDLIKKFDLENKYDMKNHFSWNITYRPESSDKYSKFFDDAKTLNKYISKHKILQKDIKDYEIIEGFLNWFDSNNLTISPSELTPSQRELYRKQLRLYIQLQNYFAIAYSHLQIDIDNLDISNWDYIQKFDKIKKNLIGIIGFNYDLLIETILKHINHDFHRIGMDEHQKGLHLFKPHGSIDFDKFHNSMNRDIENGSLCFNNDFPYQPLPKTEWLETRADIDIVLPTQKSPYPNISWIQKGYTWASQNLPTVKKCIIFGLSYWSFDRPELNYLMDILDPNCKIIVVNPNPPRVMLVKLYDKFKDVETIDRLKNGV